MALNKQKIQAAKPKAKPYKLHDGDGLFLVIYPTGGKTWRVKYRQDGKHKEMTLGQYPALSLADARLRRNDAMRQRVDGIDPAADKQAKKREDARQEREASLTFEKVADDFLRVQSSKVAPRYHKTTLERLRLHILPAIGNIPFAKLTFEDLKGVTLRLEKDGKLEMAYRVAVIINQICKHAKLNQWAAHNIADGITDIVARRPKAEIKGLPAITDAAGVAAMLQRLEEYIAMRRVTPAMAAALRLFPMLALRSSELLGAGWSEIDFEAGLFSIPAVRMKGGKPHEIPLPRQAVTIFQELYSRRIDNRFVFRSGGKTGHFAASRQFGIGTNPPCKGGLQHHGSR